jgi:protein-tyrosine kinase
MPLESRASDMSNSMSTIERAAARLGSIGKVRAEPIVKEPLASDTSHDVSAEVVPTPAPVVQDRFGGGFCTIDLESLAARGFVTQQNVHTEIAADLRRIKRPLLLAMKKAETLGTHNLPPNLVLITSSVPGEGKTFVAINLALSLAAEVDRTVLLVDADVAKSDVGTVLGVSAPSGLTELLQQGASYPEGAVLQTNIESFSLLLSGARLPNVDELFASDKMIQLMRDLALHDPNRIVIVDAQPLHAGTEASVLARIVGQVVMLVEADSTPQATVTEALHQLKGCDNVSLVLNKARRGSSDRANYGYGYGYGYGNQGS